MDVILISCIVCQAGVARTTIRTGDVPRGISLAQSSENPTLQRECGAILEVRLAGTHVSVRINRVTSRHAEALLLPLRVPAALYMVCFWQRVLLPFRVEHEAVARRRHAL